jgi:hypothetical protein
MFLIWRRKESSGSVVDPGEIVGVEVLSDGSRKSCGIEVGTSLTVLFPQFHYPVTAVSYRHLTVSKNEEVYGVVEDVLSVVELIVEYNQVQYRMVGCFWCILNIF